MTKSWQVPISNQYKGRDSSVLHFFDESPNTNRLVSTSCGKSVNPGFAKSALNSPKAHLCTKCLLAIKRDGY